MSPLFLRKAVAAVPRFNINVSKKIKKSKRKIKTGKIKNGEKGRNEKGSPKPTKEKVGFFKNIQEKKRLKLKTCNL